VYLEPAKDSIDLVVKTFSGGVELDGSVRGNKGLISDGWPPA